MKIEPAMPVTKEDLYQTIDFLRCENNRLRLENDILRSQIDMLKPDEKDLREQQRSFELYPKM